jgi:hypothetical protein
MFYAKHPTDKRWIVFAKSGDGFVRVCSYTSSATPKSLGYKKIDYPSNYEGKPLTDMINVVK